MGINRYGGFPSLEQMTDLIASNGKKVNESVKGQNQVKNGQNVGLSFAEIFRQKTEAEGAIKFSKHANERMVQRNLELSDMQLERLENGVRKAGEKGIKETLVMIDNLAFIVNVGNNTVITAVDENDSRVFTNIDGAVIA